MSTTKKLNVEMENDLTAKELAYLTGLSAAPVSYTHLTLPTKISV